MGFPDPKRQRYLGVQDVSVGIMPGRGRVKAKERAWEMGDETKMVWSHWQAFEGWLACLLAPTCLTHLSAMTVFRCRSFSHIPNRQRPVSKLGSSIVLSLLDFPRVSAH